MIRYWKKGDKDPDHGKPYRHTLEKIRMMLDSVENAPYSQGEFAATLESVLWHVAEKHPVEVLDAILKVVDEFEGG